MRVLNPGPGEIVDRLTVVARKIVEGGERAKHFEEEMEELFDWWDEQGVGEVNEKFAKASYLLAAVNAAIWQREDELRLRRKKAVYVDEVGAEAIAFKIQDLNDRRAKLVEEINAAAGIKREEKL